MQNGRNTMPGFELTPLDLAEGRRLLVPNRATEQGHRLGAHMARMCDVAAKEAGRDGRCATCAFRAGDHMPNGSPETIMDALKCVLERTPFVCHDPGRKGTPCSGWLLLRSDADDRLHVPWPMSGGYDEAPAS